jgi:p-aminobenzoyl-glutamate transporter AbgT
VICSAHPWGLGAWWLLLVAWMVLGFPLGPGAGLYLEPAGA